jgi:PLP dependent protein
LIYFIAMSIASNIKELNNAISQVKHEHNINTPVNILVATKYAKPEDISKIKEAGLHLFGENRLQQFEEKFGDTHKDVNWHFIGHLQKNKVNKVVQQFNCIESLDSLKLMEKVNQSATTQNKKMEGFIQVNIANDPNKTGFSKEEALELLPQFFSFKMLEIRGIMAIVPYAEDVEECREHFKQLKTMYDLIRKSYPSVSTLSMGMSHDYKVAIEEGSNLVRIGSLIFK